MGWAEIKARGQAMGPSGMLDSTSTEQGDVCVWVLPSADDFTQREELGHPIRKSPERCSGLHVPKSSGPLVHEGDGPQGLWSFYPVEGMAHWVLGLQALGPWRRHATMSPGLCCPVVHC